MFTFESHTLVAEQCKTGSSVVNGDKYPRPSKPLYLENLHLSITYIVLVVINKF